MQQELDTSSDKQQLTSVSSSNLSFDVCIICAMAEEAKAFMEAAEHQCNARFQSALSSGKKLVYYYTTISNNKGEPLNIQVSWQPSFGPVEASLHLQQILDEFKPHFAAMTGICAGDKSQVKLGDIIVAERAFLYDTGKFISGEDGSSHQERDTETRHPHTDVLHFVRGFDGWKSAVQNLVRPVSKHQQRDWLLKKLLEKETPRIDDIERLELEHNAPDWRKILRALQEGSDAYITRGRMLKDPAKVYDLFYGEETFPYQDPKQPAVHIAPIASGNAVRADNPFNEIRTPVRGTVALDMEGATFYRTTDDFSSMRSLLVKGVSDYADSDKDDSYQKYASAVSAAYMLSFIQEYVTTSRIPGLSKRTTISQGIQLQPGITKETQPPVSTHKATQSPTDALNVFYSYAPEDEALRSKLEIHLKLLKRQGYIAEWHSHKVSAGQVPEQETALHLSQAKIILLLISPYFLASDNCYEKEMMPALGLLKADRTLRVIPILLRPTDDLEKTPIGHLLAIPRNKKPVTTWKDLDTAFAEIAREIRAVVEQLKSSL